MKKRFKKIIVYDSTWSDHNDATPLKPFVELASSILAITIYPIYLWASLHNRKVYWEEIKEIKQK